MKHRPSVRVAYVMSRFPKLTETFVLGEILEVERQGLDVEIYPLLRQRESTIHREAHDLIRRAHYRPFLSVEVLVANWRSFRRSPLGYLGVWWEMLRYTFGSANFFFGALAILPKSVLFAEDMLRRGITHVHAHFANHPALAALIVHRLTGIPYSFTAHGSDVHVDRTMLTRKVAASAFAVTVSSYNQELMVRECGEGLRDKIRVVRCGVDTERFRPGSIPIETRPSRFLCVGSLSAVKGQRHLVAACERLRRAAVDFQCDIVGEGPLRSSLDRQIRRAGLSGSVRLRGACSRDEILRLLHDSDVVVLPSVPTRQGKREGIPVALMEAMAVGRPVVASNVSGIPELVRSGVSGLLIPPGDERALSAALRKLSEDPSMRRRMGRAGRKRVAELFDSSKNVAELMELFVGSAQSHVKAGADLPRRTATEATHELRPG